MAKQAVRYVGVHLLDAPYLIDREYEYYLPRSLSSDVRVGSLVAVPFGAANRRTYALVVRVSDQSEMDKVKPLLAVLPDRFSLSEELRGLCFFLKEHTLCSVGDAVRCIIPGAVFSAISEWYVLPPEGEEKPDPCVVKPGVPAETGDPYVAKTDAAPAGTSDDAEERGREAVLACLRTDGPMEAGELSRRCACRPALLQDMVAQGLLVHRWERRPESVRTEKRVALARPREEILALLGGTGKPALRSEAHIRILRYLCGEGDAERAALCAGTHTTTAQVAALCRRGLLTISEEPVLRDPYAAIKRTYDRTPIVLTRAQQAAYGQIEEVYNTHEARAVLLHGVTGSGKTKVMMALMDRVIDEGRQVILMVPEIGLTPQTVSVFCARYGDRVAVIHSMLSEGERLDTYRRIAAGEVDLLIGTRSAVFAPFDRLGLIVMDEEHEHTYKSDADPKYHARDVAAYRCGQQKALLLLASATPSLESYYKAESGRYTLVSLRERYGGAPLPRTEIVDLREELRAGNRSPVSEALHDALQETLANDEQAILFLNRRGFHTSVHCKDCGEALVCPHCSVALTHHTDKNGGCMVCHSCGYRGPLPAACPACGGTHLSYLGFGTQKAEGELAACLPGARILRMDADTTGTRRAYDDLLSRFRAREADVMLGTQMVTKGHDFPAVTLVGVLLADTSLYVNDFRASERTFALITQVIGRAGRAERPGRAIIQTYVPHNETIRLACQQDYESFYRSEIALRRALSFPPFCDIVQMTLTCPREDLLLSAAPRLSAGMVELARREYADLPLYIFGPFEAQVYKAAGKYRLRMILKCKNNRRTREYLSRILTDFGRHEGRHITLSVDINPQKG